MNFTFISQTETGNARMRELGQHYKSIINYIADGGVRAAEEYLASKRYMKLYVNKSLARDLCKQCEHAKNYPAVIEVRHPDTGEVQRNEETGEAFVLPINIDFELKSDTKASTLINYHVATMRFMEDAA